ncbi:SAM-dependent methyltransferase [Actinoplanes regularis]|uniref:S-adenosyl methyltransferase n=1 Tax=Actinoplanes regularis TaxID=52697 RepID=A0A239EPT2_9ACTN|nr:SAM-dependent methyltransferase [Actinoplanes regularis]GIE89874.1 hypothetical protein Are01nite_63540 [Actinoplanes regularis]SNS45932.1 S-adenosyl methyltransferase [Actinoplanes regularis]
MSIDPNRPNSARVYNTLLGGTHNFAVDREVASRMMEIIPDLGDVARANRAVMRRVVRYAVAHGVHQFIDLGSGIPAEGNVHEIAQALDPRARVAYVDHDPTAVLYTRDLLGADPRAIVLQADLCDTESVLGDPGLRSLLDLSRPTMILMFAVLHFVPDGPALDAALHRYRKAVAPGSLLALSHFTAGLDPEASSRVADLLSRTGTPLVPRDKRQITALLDGWELVEPGVVRGADWHPDPTDEPLTDRVASQGLVAVGRR